MNESSHLPSTWCKSLLESPSTLDNTFPFQITPRGPIIQTHRWLNNMTYHLQFQSSNICLPLKNQFCVMVHESLASFNEQYLLCSFCVCYRWSIHSVSCLICRRWWCQDESSPPVPREALMTNSTGRQATTQVSLHTRQGSPSIVS